MKTLVAQSCPILCNPMDCSLPGSSVHGIFQARILGWVAISFSRGIFLTRRSNPGLPHYRQTPYPLSHQGSPKKVKVKALIVQSRPTLCNHMDCSLPGSSVHGILQARILKWVPFSRGFSQPRDQTQVSCIAGRFFTSWPPREAPRSSSNRNTCHFFPKYEAVRFGIFPTDFASDSTQFFLNLP